MRLPSQTAREISRRSKVRAGQKRNKSPSLGVEKTPLGKNKCLLLHPGLLKQPPGYLLWGWLKQIWARSSQNSVGWFNPGANVLPEEPYDLSKTINKKRYQGSLGSIWSETRVLFEEHWVCQHGVRGGRGFPVPLPGLAATKR